MKTSQKGLAPIILTLIVAIMLGGAAGYVVVKTNPSIKERFGLKVEKKEKQKTEQQQEKKTGEKDTLSLEQVKNATYDLHNREASLFVSATLKNGTYAKEYFQGKGSGAPNATYRLALLRENLVAFGDLDNDDKGDAAVILVENYGGGNGAPTYLAILRSDNGKPHYEGGLLIGDRDIKVTGLSVESGFVKVGMIVPKSGDPVCCPTQPVDKFYRMQSPGVLVEATERFPSSVEFTIPPGWKTYRNDKYGFEFRYPEEQSISEQNNTVYALKSIRGSDAGITMSFEVIKGTIEDFIRAYENQDPPFTKITKRESISKNGVPGVRLIAESPLGLTTQYFVVERGTQSLVVHYLGREQERILSTLKLTNKN